MKYISRGGCFFYYDRVTFSWEMCEPTLLFLLGFEAITTYDKSKSDQLLISKNVYNTLTGITDEMPDFPIYDEFLTYMSALGPVEDHEYYAFSNLRGLKLLMNELTGTGDDRIVPVIFLNDNNSTLVDPSNYSYIDKTKKSYNDLKAEILLNIFKYAGYDLQDNAVPKYSESLAKESSAPLLSEIQSFNNDEKFRHEQKQYIGQVYKLLDYKAMYSYALGVLYGLRCLDYDKKMIWRIDPDTGKWYDGKNQNLVRTACATFRFHYTHPIFEFNDDFMSYRNASYNRLWNFINTDEIADIKLYDGSETSTYSLYVTDEPHRDDKLNRITATPLTYLYQLNNDRFDNRGKYIKLITDDPNNIRWSDPISVIDDDDYNKDSNVVSSEKPYKGVVAADQDIITRYIAHNKVKIFKALEYYRDDNNYYLCPNGDYLLLDSRALQNEGRFTLSNDLTIIPNSNYYIVHLSRASSNHIADNNFNFNLSVVSSEYKTLRGRDGNTLSVTLKRTDDNKIHIEIKIKDDVIYSEDLLVFDSSYINNSYCTAAGYTDKFVYQFLSFSEANFDYTAFYESSSVLVMNLSGGSSYYVLSNYFDHEDESSDMYMLNSIAPARTLLGGDYKYFISTGNFGWVEFDTTYWRHFYKFNGVTDESSAVLTMNECNFSDLQPSRIYDVLAIENGTVTSCYKCNVTDNTYLYGIFSSAVGEYDGVYNEVTYPDRFNGIDKLFRYVLSEHDFDRLYQLVDHLPENYKKFDFYDIDKLVKLIIYTDADTLPTDYFFDGTYCSQFEDGLPTSTPYLCLNGYTPYKSYSVDNVFMYDSDADTPKRIPIRKYNYNMVDYYWSSCFGVIEDKIEWRTFADDCYVLTKNTVTLYMNVTKIFTDEPIYNILGSNQDNRRNFICNLLYSNGTYGFSNHGFVEYNNLYESYGITDHLCQIVEKDLYGNSLFVNGVPYVWKDPETNKYWNGFTSKWQLDIPVRSNAKMYDANNELLINIIDDTENRTVTVDDVTITYTEFYNTYTNCGILRDDSYQVFCEDRPSDGIVSCYYDTRLSDNIDDHFVCVPGYTGWVRRSELKNSNYWIVDGTTQLYNGTTSVSAVYDDEHSD